MMGRLLVSMGLLFSLAVGTFSTTFAQGMEPRDDFALAKVISVLSETMDNSPASGPRIVQVLKLRMISGEENGKELTVENGIIGSRADQKLSEGETIIVERITRPDGERIYLLKERYRLPALGWLFALFVGLAVLLGGITSLMSVVGLIVSIGILLWVVLPQILAGQNPLFASLLGCTLIACTSLYLAHGFSRRTSVALLSTLLTLAISTVLALLFVYFGKLFGMGSEEAMFLQIGPLGTIDLRGLLLGGMLIGCLGVLDDITTAQTAAVDELSKANPRLTPLQLQRAGMSIGREHIASLINTLALAYVGTSLPLLLLFKVQTDFPLWVSLNGEFLAEEIVRTLVGSATLLFAVPISTWCASVLLRGRNGPSLHTHSHHHHHA